MFIVYFGYFEIGSTTSSSNLSKESTFLEQKENIHSKLLKYIYFIEVIQNIVTFL